MQSVSEGTTMKDEKAAAPQVEGEVHHVGSPANIRATWIRLADGIRDGYNEIDEEALAALIAYAKRQALVSSNSPISDGKTYQLEGESLVTCDVGAWYETAVYWKHRALASEASKPVREMSPWEYMNRGAA